MKDILVKEIMIPISDYVTVTKDANLTEMLRAIEEKRAADQGHAHRDAIVVDEAGTMPLYWPITATITKPYVSRTYSTTGFEAYWKWDIIE